MSFVLMLILRHYSINLSELMFKHVVFIVLKNVSRSQDLKTFSFYRISYKATLYKIFSPSAKKQSNIQIVKSILNPTVKRVMNH